MRVPEGLTYYYGDRARGAAIDLLVASDKPPRDLSWDEAIEYHEAKLSAAKVQTDHACFLMRAWQAIWGEASKSNQVGTQVSVGERENAIPTVESIWDEPLYNEFLLENGWRVWAGIWLDEPLELRLSFYVEREQGTYVNIDPLDLGADWLPADDRERSTRPGLCPIEPETAEVELSQLYGLASAALNAVSTASRPERRRRGTP